MIVKNERANEFEIWKDLMKVFRGLNLSIFLTFFMVNFEGYKYE